ncbi:hypothetical protein [Mycolicibacterium sp. D5.8-2]|uniref:hypothetical protein n=1 Tax=Mycolicibacterium sp. D5.8-2 TaxID=3085903 RepID=UPI00298BCE2F|nr:hypothetical protein [Mycolicibacterium sp. D5.8-2]MDW5614958.1 hypothetical protein [Mycolicibacterium sp. D5.8-2]
MTPEQKEVTRRAVDVMTAWATDRTGGADNFTRDRFVENATADGDSGFDLAIGFQNLAGWLLIQREIATGKSPRDQLQEYALWLENH